MSPSETYYAALVGRWEGSFRVRVTDRAILGTQPLRARLLGWAAHLGGPMRMQTTLAGDGRRFRHTTRVLSFGVPAFATDEEIELADDGLTLRMNGSQRGPFGTERYTSTGDIDASATRATYHIPWLGSPLVQRTRIVPEGLELTQETAWSYAEVLLRRRAEPRALPR